MDQIRYFRSYLAWNEKKKNIPSYTAVSVKADTFNENIQLRWDDLSCSVSRPISNEANYINFHTKIDATIEKI